MAKAPNQPAANQFSEDAGPGRTSPVVVVSTAPGNAAVTTPGQSVPDKLGGRPRTDPEVQPLPDGDQQPSTKPVEN